MFFADSVFAALFMQLISRLTVVNWEHQFLSFDHQAHVSLILMVLNINKEVIHQSAQEGILESLKHYKGLHLESNSQSFDRWIQKWKLLNFEDRKWAGTFDFPESISNLCVISKISSFKNGQLWKCQRMSSLNLKRQPLMQ